MSIEATRRPGITTGRDMLGEYVLYTFPDWVTAEQRARIRAHMNTFFDAKVAESKALRAAVTVTR